MGDYIDIVFDGPPGPVCGRFVETEDSSGKGIRAGEWVDRPDGYCVLRIPTDADLRARLELFREHVCDECQCAPVHAYTDDPCIDCEDAQVGIYNMERGNPPRPEYCASAISVGMRALCGRKVIPWKVGEV